MKSQNPKWCTFYYFHYFHWTQNWYFFPSTKYNIHSWFLINVTYDNIRSYVALVEGSRSFSWLWDWALPPSKAAVCGSTFKASSCMYYSFKVSDKKTSFCKKESHKEKKRNKSESWELYLSLTISPVFPHWIAANSYAVNVWKRFIVLHFKHIARNIF